MNSSGGLRLAAGNEAATTEGAGNNTQATKQGPWWGQETPTRGGR
uniref:Uncharacterized protein n=1 Tax=Arundo donax TaxID=35708 RepID=A0A0A9C0X7_ARUDO